MCYNQFVTWITHLKWHKTNAWALKCIYRTLFTQCHGENGRCFSIQRSWIKPSKWPKIPSLFMYGISIQLNENSKLERKLHMDWLPRRIAPWYIVRVETTFKYHVWISQRHNQWRNARILLLLRNNFKLDYVWLENVVDTLIWRGKNTKSRT